MADARPKFITQLDVANSVSANDLFVVEQYNFDGTSNTKAISYQNLFANVNLNQSALLLAGNGQFTSDDNNSVTWLILPNTIKSGSIAVSATDLTNTDIIGFTELSFVYLPNSNTVLSNSYATLNNGTPSIDQLNSTPVVVGNNLVFGFSRSDVSSSNVVIKYSGTLFT